jgi:serine/threonine-protein kinase
MAAVYEVAASDGSHFAAKVFEKSGSPATDGLVLRFLREAKVASAIDSEHVVRVVGANRDPHLDLPFIIMELLDGIDLRTLYRQLAPIAPEALVRVFLQAARGLAAAHRLGIVHRDIKPSNIFLHHDSQGDLVSVKICDFGIAKMRSGDPSSLAQSAELTATRGMLGSPHYMAPEQAVSPKTADHRSDIWSLSLSLHHGLCGKRPWLGHSSLGEILVALSTRPVSRLEQAAPWLPPRLCEVVHRGLLRDASERWSDVDEMIEALEPFALGASLVHLRDLISVRDSARLRRAEGPTGEPAVNSNLHVVSSRLVSDSNGAERPESTDLSLAPGAKEPSAGARSRPVPAWIQVGKWATLGAAVGAVSLATMRAFVSMPATPLPPTTVIAPRSGAPEHPPNVAGMEFERPPETLEIRPAKTEPLPRPPSPPSRPRRAEHDVGAKDPALAPVTTSSPSLSPPRDECRPPYVVDPTGVRHVKPNCL